MATLNYSLIIPVYKNESTLPELLTALENLHKRVKGDLEVVFVVDGSPDCSFEKLKDACDSGLPFRTQLVAHSRNFGSFPAIRTGLMHAEGEFFAIMAADLQEPLHLIEEFYQSLSRDECDVVVGSREFREDPLSTRLSSTLFWAVYRRFVVHDMPPGGVDVFGCNQVFREHLLQLEESRSSLIALLFWLGFRRKTIPYRRNRRAGGVSGWTLKKKLDYMFDSIFAFTDFPIRFLLRIGAAGCLLSLMMTLAVSICYLFDLIPVPGYTATMIVLLFFGGTNLLALGLVGSYAWRAYENSKQRPLAVVAKKQRYPGEL